MRIRHRDRHRARQRGAVRRLLPLAFVGALARMAAPAWALPSCQQALLSALGGLEHEAHVLVLLSPRMPMALQQWPRMRDTAERAGFRVIAMRDPQVPAAEWRAGVEATGQPDLRDATALQESAATTCRLLNHAPSALVGRCGQVHPWPVPGVMPDGAWLAVLQQRREAIPCP